MFDSKRNVLFYLQPSAVTSAVASDLPDEEGAVGEASGSSVRKSGSTILADAEAVASSSTAIPARLFSSTSSTGQTTTACAMPALFDELSTCDTQSWLRFCAEQGLHRRISRRLAPGDSRRLGVLNRKVVEVQSIALSPSAASLLKPEIFPRLR